MANRKTNGKRSAKERMEESMRQQTGENAAMAYLKFLRDTDHRGTLDEVAFGMYAAPRSAALEGQAAAFFSKLEKILRQTAPLLQIRRADDHDQMCAAFVHAFSLTGPQRAAYLKELPETLPETLIKEREAAAKKAEAAKAEQP